MRKLRVIHYINQFFAQIGGEEKADIPPQLQEGCLGPGRLLQDFFGEDAEIIATVICGDTYFAQNQENAQKEIVALVKKYQPDLFVAGPAFNAGRYGVACVGSSQAINEKLEIPVITAMFKENPAVELASGMYIVSTADSARKMKDAMKPLSMLALKLARGEEIGFPEEEGYLPRGVRRNYFAEKTGAVRAVDMLLRKLKGEPFETEYQIPSFDRVAPSPAVKDLSKATIAMVTSGGIVPKGNPDRIASSSASNFGEYSLEGLDSLTRDMFETAHGGYDPTYANSEPGRVLPLDALRHLENEGIIGSLHNLYYTTVGNGTSVGNSREFGSEIAKRLKSAGVTAVILTST